MSPDPPSIRTSRGLAERPSGSGGGGHPARGLDRAHGSLPLVSWAGDPAAQPSWGVIIADGRDLLFRAWWISTFPGIAIFLFVLGINLLGEGLRDALDPRLATERIPE